MKKSMLRALLCVSALTPVAALAQAAANGPPADDAAVTSNAPGLATGDIVVTARKREENLQDVPIAITAFDSAEIRSARIERLSDVAKLTPGLIFTPLFGRQNQLPIIRGAAQTFGQLNVGVFLDGIYLSGKGGVDLELNDLERVEIIKGPQSALYGRNTFAGAINYVTKRPSADLGGRAEATIGDNGLYKGIASISGPLSDGLRFRVGGFYRKFDGWYTSAIDGGRIDFEKSYGAIGTLEYAPDDALTVTLRGSYSKDDLGQPPSSVIRNNSAIGTPAGGSATQRRNLLYVGQVPNIPENGVTVNTITAPGQPSPYGDREESIRTSLAFEYDFGNATLTSITAYAKRNAEYTFDGDNTFCDRTGGCPNFGFPFAPAIPLGASRFALSSNDGYSRDVSQELRLQSNGNNTVNWLFGLFYYDNHNIGTDRGFSPITTPAASAYSGFNTNYSYPYQALTTKSYAAFGSATWNVTGAFALTGELRYEYEEQTFFQRPTFTTAAAPVAITPSTPFAGSVALFDLRQSFRFVTPRVIANYRFSPEALGYVSYARGAKTGGFNTGLNVFADQRSYQPEYSDNYEVGLKTDLFDRQLRFNVAGFYIDWKDQQAACQNPISAGGSSSNRTYTCNVAASHIYGAEVEAVARVGDYVSVVANYAYTHARYTRFVDDSLAQTLVAAGLPPIASFDGRHLPYVPDHKFLISPRITVPLGGADNSVEARADLQYQSRSFLRADNFQSFGAKTVLDLRLTGRFDPFTVQLFANNVLNDRTPTAAVRFFDSVNYSVSSPLVTGANLRQFGISAGVTF